jgi:pyruvate/2-oxoglutarate/acetoin dehydrogenase E1 component
MATDEEVTGGVLASTEGLIAQYQTTRVRAMGWAGYKRYFRF